MTDQLLQRIAECKIVPVVKIDDVADTLPLMKALAEGGIMSAEITFRTACGPDALALAAKSCPEIFRILRPFEECSLEGRLHAGDAQSRHAQHRL